MILAYKYNSLQFFSYINDVSAGIPVIIPYEHVNEDTFVKSGVHYGEFFFHAPIWL